MSAEHDPSTRGRGGSSRASRSGPGAEDARRLQRSLCAFWLGDHCYGVETALVGEVVEIDAVIPVPLAPAAVRGLFNLRGTPVALVDPSRMLELPDSAAADEPRPGRHLLGLVLRTERLLVALSIRRMEMVITRGRGFFSVPDASAAEHPAVAGFLQLPDRAGLTVTVLDSDALRSRIDRLRFLDSSDN
jgi:purine-binding chemotaxis protein CheW